MRSIIGFVCAMFVIGCSTRQDNPDQQMKKPFTETYRPQIHFSPKEKWMNDPNGMVYHNDEYHLFYQYYPDSTVWGPMHWGHTVSTDLVHWTHLPIALYPDSLGMIFSGSAVVDKNNSSGFGTSENPALIAIYTYHDALGEKQGRNDFQTQGLAYSTDNGRTWIKYENNPIIKNPGQRDFRDPKVFWHEESKKWILILVAGDHAEIYGSTDLKSWNKRSEFGKEYGAHGGVWECPDLFPLTVEGEQTEKWVMIININPGGPNGGSGTQYFLGEFDGEKFSCDTKKSKTSWVDYGPDNYAGITWSNAPGDRKIFIGWMSNWSYAQVVPTTPWRSATTVARELKLLRVNDSLHISSIIWPELQKLATSRKEFKSIVVKDSIDLKPEVNFPITISLIEGYIEAKDFVFEFSNDSGQKVMIGYESSENRFFIDRKSSGGINFSKHFTNNIYAPRIASGRTIKFTMVTDVSSIEVFFDDGVSVMTSLFFPDPVLENLKIYSPSGEIKIDALSVSQLSPIW